MAELAEVGPGDRVLDVGTGSGYAAAVLARLAARVHSIERHAPLAEEARRLLAETGHANVQIHVGDGTLGWPEAAPFDAIVVAAGAPAVPDALKQQLAVGGRLVIPVGEGERGQELLRVRRLASGRFEEERLGPVVFVPLIGEQGWDAASPPRAGGPLTGTLPEMNRRTALPHGRRHLVPPLPSKMGEGGGEDVGKTPVPPLGRVGQGSCGQGPG